MVEARQLSFEQLGILPYKVVRRMPIAGEAEFRRGGKDNRILTPDAFAQRLANLYGDARVGEVDEDGMVEIIVVDKPKISKPE